MDTEVIVAAIAFIGTLVGSYFANSKTTAVMQEQIKDLKKDISTLSNRVDKHNNLVERMVAVEQSTKSAHHRIDNIGGN
jgi:type VI protein secretion system component VasK